MNNLLIIGGDSYIGKTFINCLNDTATIGIISRRKTFLENEIVIEDLSTIPDEILKDYSMVVSFIGIAHKKKVSKELFNAVNYKLVVEIAKKCKRNNISYFIQMSSLSVYGDSRFINKNTKENPNTDYGSSKLKADIELLGLQNEGFSVLLLRPPMIYGKDAPGNIRRLEKLVNTGLPLPFQGVNNKRFCLSVDNFCRILKDLLQEHKKGIAIFCDPQPLSTYSIIKIIADSKNRNIFYFSYKSMSLLKLFKRDLYRKLFEDLIIEGNIALNTELKNPNEELSKIYGGIND